MFFYLLTLPTRPNPLANILPVVDRERQNIIQINLVVHIVDIKSEIIGVKFNRIEVARVNFVCLKVRLYFLNRAAQIL